MKLSFPNSSEIIANENLTPTTSWFTYFQDIWKMLSGGLSISIGGMLNINTTSANNVSTGATDLISYSLAPFLKNNGDVLEIEAWGVYAANANNKTITLNFGGQTILTTGAIAANDGSWNIRATIIKKSATTQEIIASIISSNSSVFESATRTAGTQDLTIALVIKCVGTGGATNDITQHALKINLTPNT